MSHRGSTLGAKSPVVASIEQRLPANASDQTQATDTTESRAAVRNVPILPATADPFAPAIPPGRFELETTVWEIDQKAIRDGVTGPPLLNPRSALELLDPIVSGDFKYPHEEFWDQPLPPFVLYRTRENVTQVFHAPPLNKCVRKVRTTPTKSEHDPEPESVSRAYTDADTGFLTTDGSQFSRRLAPSLNAAGQMTLTLEFERALRIGEPGAEDRTRRKTFTVDPLHVDETLVVLEVDPEADKVWLWEIKPGQKGRNLLAKSVPSAVPLTVTDVPFGLRTTVWQIDQKVLRSGAIKPVTLQPHSVVGLLSKLVSLKFSRPQHPYPAFEMFRTQLDVATVLKQPGLSHCTEQLRTSVSRHDHTQQVGTLTGPLTSEDVSAVAKGDGRRITLKLTPVMTEAGSIELNVQADRKITGPVDAEQHRSGDFDTRVDTPATQNFDSSFLAYGQSLFVLELDPLADEILLFEIQPKRPALDRNSFAPPTVSSTPVLPFPDVPSQAAALPEPVFSGKTFDEWKRVVLTERNPADLKTAVEALGRLGRGRRDREAAETILRILAPFDPAILLNRSSRQPLSGEAGLLTTALAQLRQLNHDELVHVVSEVLLKPRGHLQRLVLEQLAIRSNQSMQEVLAKSSEFLDAVIAAWPDLNETDQSYAFQYLLDSERSEVAIKALRNWFDGLIRKPGSSFYIAAIRFRIELTPDDVGTLPEQLLEFLEEPDKPGPGVAEGTDPNSKSWPSWVYREEDAWAGLAALRDKAAPYAGRIAELLQHADGKLTNRGIDVPVDFGLRSDQTDQGFIITQPVSNVTKRLLIYELLGRLGPLAADQSVVLQEQEATQFAVLPDIDGDYGFVAADQSFVLDLTKIPFSIGPASVSRSDPSSPYIRGGFPAQQPSHIPDANARVRNALLLALQRISGQPVRFGENSVGIDLADSPNEKQKQVASGDRRSRESQRLSPRLVSYLGRSFGEWLNCEPTTSEERRSLVRGVTVLSRDAQEEDASKLLGVLTTQLRALLETEDFWKEVTESTAARDAANEAAAWLVELKPQPLEDLLTQMLRNGLPQARLAVLRLFAAPEVITNGVAWPVATAVSKHLDKSDQFQTAVESVFETASKQQPEVLRTAIRYCMRRPVARTIPTFELLKPLLDADDKAVRAETAITMTRLLEMTRSYATGTAWYQLTSKELAPGLADRLLDAIEKTPPDVEMLEVAIALREVMPALRMSDESPERTRLNERLLKLLEHDCQADQTPLIQITLTAPPSGVPLVLPQQWLVPGSGLHDHESTSHVSPSEDADSHAEPTHSRGRPVAVRGADEQPQRSAVRLPAVREAGRVSRQTRRQRAGDTNRVGRGLETEHAVSVAARVRPVES
ncbi:MAG: hypothetical protein HQ518_08320 [Rhodopirellula sp.]|nr:hypothetical protein [Rhodopirellula sp.]